jgi:hypothetical protein
MLLHDTLYYSRLDCFKKLQTEEMSIVALKQREWSNGYGCLFSDICPLEAGSFSLGHLSGLLALVVSDI